MSRHRAVAGLLLLCAFAFVALAAPNAQALQGTTLFTCKAVPHEAQFEDEHCNKAKAGLDAGWAHTSIAENISTATEGTNAKPGTKQKKPRTLC